LPSDANINDALLHRHRSNNVGCEVSQIPLLSCSVPLSRPIAHRCDSSMPFRMLPANFGNGLLHCRTIWLHWVLGVLSGSESGAVFVRSGLPRLHRLGRFVREHFLSEGVEARSDARLSVICYSYSVSATSIFDSRACWALTRREV